MRTNIDIDNGLLAEAMKLGGLQTKKAVVEKALQHFVRHHRRKKAWEELRGLGWEGDLDEMRRDIDPNEPLLPDHHKDAAE
ncbi:type II toxin-antitoxin system VapB family antitoxin [Rhizobium deserti]|uniref:Type II toxin-antitoxin system VapB family antitoxin n=1 Tax=Rhizobium deserti TaxID=2547961 RepID=A0A4R5UJZ7_9HYPH|nr:type II toxin-antitoxin system VapB family antitoxin [Rhizobium deserti]TDK37190.1 type II toxin-antitoxin system VapB family antitoxin [Rhizobium deserti]